MKGRGPTGSLLSLGDQIRDFAKITGDRINVVHKNVSQKLFTQIVYDTPVDTGAARGAWRASMGSPNLAPNGRLDRGGAMVAKEIEVTIKANRDQISFLANNLEYIVALEYGWSKQAPQGMVRINVQRFQTLIKQEVAEARAKGRIK